MLLVLAWIVTAPTTPAELERKIERQLQQRFPEGMEEGAEDSHGSPLWYRSAGYTKLTHNDELLSCTDRARDGKALIGAMYDAQTRKWKACSDIWDVAVYPHIVDWNKDAEFHISGTCKVQGQNVSQCHYGSKKSWHRG